MGVRSGVIPMVSGRWWRHCGGIGSAREPEKGTNIMFAIIAIVIAALVALAILGAAAHLLFSPFVLLIAIGILVWVKFRPGRGRR